MNDAVARALHELRGPLSAVRLGVELGARLGSLSGERLRAMELELGRAALALEELDANLSGAACRRGGWLATTTGRAPVALGPLLEASVEAWRPVAGTRAIVLEVGAVGGGGVEELSVMGERLRLAQATGNLLANAIEHGAGTIVVRARPAADGVVRVEVGDEGAGLGAPLGELLRQRSHHGLRVAAEVAAACGGRLISAPSEHGARLVLELPLVEARSARRTGSASAA